MPELPEVETVARGLSGYLGKSLTKLTLFDPKVWFESELAPEDFRNRTLTKISRRGKYLIFDFGGRYLVQHLRMTGKMLALDSPAVPEKIRKALGSTLQLRAEFAFANRKLYFYDTRRFGTLTALQDIEKFWAKKGIAPDPIEAEPEARKIFLDRIANSPRSIKALLLDQQVIAGVGNIYTDECLHKLKIHPLQQGSKIREKNQLFSSVRELLLRAIDSRGTSVFNYVDADGRRGSFANQLQVYARKNELCLSCKQSKIQVMQVAGRSTHFCPDCQKRGR